MIFVLIRYPSGPLPNKSAVKYLGVIIDHRLTWEEHTQHVVQKLSTARGILSKLRHHARQSVPLNVYYSIVYPYPTYIMVSRHGTELLLNIPTVFRLNKTT